MIRRISTLAVCLALCISPSLGFAQENMEVNVQDLVEQIKAGGDEAYMAVDRLAAV